MAHESDDDGIEDLFVRFQSEIRAKLLKKTNALQDLGLNITTLNTQISKLHGENEATIKEGKLEEARVLAAHTQQVVELRKKAKHDRQKHDTIAKEMAANTEMLAVKEKELANTKELAVKMKQRMEKTQQGEALLASSINAQVVKIGLVELEVESVRMRNREMHQENKKLKEKFSRRIRECEKQEAEMSASKPKMLDVVDKMVVDYRKMTQQILQMDEKQQRIIHEKAAIIASLEKADVAKKRKLTDGTSTPSATAADPVV